MADFGLTTEQSSDTGLNTERARATDAYKAPELKPNSNYNRKVDIWALGCVLYQLVALAPAFNGVAENKIPVHLKRIHDDLLPQALLDKAFDAETSSRVSSLIREMLDITPSARPEASTLLQKFDGHRNQLRLLNGWPLAE